MSKPLVVSIPHRLGKDEAVRRLKSGLANARTSFGSMMTITEESWSGNTLSFGAGLLGQRASGVIEVFDEHVQVEVQLPWILARLAEKARGLVQKQTQLMLEKK